MALLDFILPGAGLAVGLIQGKRQADEAKRRENLNAQLGSLDTAYSTFLKTPSQKVANTDPGAGALGGALTGGLAGYAQSQGIQEAMSKGNYYDQLAKKLQDSKAGTQLASTIKNASLSGGTQLAANMPAPGQNDYFNLFPGQPKYAGPLRAQ